MGVESSKFIGRRCEQKYKSIRRRGPLKKSGRGKAGKDDKGGFAGEIIPFSPDALRDPFGPTARHLEAIVAESGLYTCCRNGVVRPVWRGLAYAWDCNRGILQARVNDLCRMEYGMRVLVLGLLRNHAPLELAEFCEAQMACQPTT